MADRSTIPSLNQRQAATLLGVTPRTLRDWQDAPRNKDKSYNAADLVQWRIESLLEAERTRLAVDGELGGMGDSPALERYRNARAGQEEMKLQQMRGELVPVDFARRVLTMAALKIRRAGELLARNHGNDAADILISVLDEWQADLKREGTP